MRAWRVVARTDKLGNRLWSVQYDPIFRDPDSGGRKQYGIWREDRVCRDESRAHVEMSYLKEYA